jgi:hypothetical protein
MLNTTLETPWYAMGLGVVFFVGFFAAWLQTGAGKLLWGCFGSFIVFGGLVALEAIVTTEREQIVATVVSIARAVEKQDFDKAISFIHPSQKATRLQALSELKRYKIKRGNVKNNLALKLHSNRTPIEASVGFNVFVQGGIAINGFAEQQGPRYLHAEFVFMAEENRWYLTSYGHMDIRAGLIHHANLRSQ